MKRKDPSARHDAFFKFRSKKDPQQSFEVRARDMARTKKAYKILNLKELNGAEPIPLKVENAVRFVRDRLGRYFLVGKEEREPSSSTIREYRVTRSGCKNIPNHL